MKRWTLLLAGAALWLFLAAIPALADGGPHVAATNSGSSTLTADSCAGCHRAHTAQGQYLLVQEEEELCLSCHGSTGNGATTDVERGLQYASLTSGPTDPKAGPLLGALRNGGFDEAAIAAHDATATTAGPMRLTYIRNNIGDISTRPKVPVLGSGATLNPEPVNSAHMDIHTPGATGKVWGNGSSGLVANTPVVTLGCTSCHNPHGNEQYRILNPVPNGSNVVASSAFALALTDNNDEFTTSADNDFIVGSRVTIADNTNTLATYWDEAADPPVLVTNGVINGTFTVASVAAASGTANVRVFKLAGVDITTGQPAGSVTGTATREAEVLVKDSPLGTASAGGAYPTKNYTVQQVKGTPGTDATFLLYASDVLAARGGSASWPQGSQWDYSAAGGDYFRRTVPWNPTVTNPSCDPTVNPSTSGNFVVPANATACATINDAPNGRPTTWATSGAGASVPRDHVAFNDQMTAWCSACHTRYYAVSLNPNPTGTKQGPPASEVIIISSNAANDRIYTVLDNAQLAVNDTVKIEGHGDPAVNGNWYVAAAGNEGTTAVPNRWFTIKATSGGPVFDITTGSAAIPNTPNGFVTRTSQAVPPPTAQAWWFPRKDDATYKYQHQTTSNRTCTTCHVAHGSNAVMADTDPADGIQGYSATLAYPDGSDAAQSSRLLKLDNRGTCQMCHEPTGTIGANVLLPTGAPQKAP